MSRKLKDIVSGLPPVLALPVALLLSPLLPILFAIMFVVASIQHVRYEWLDTREIDGEWYLDCGNKRCKYNWVERGVCDFPIDVVLDRARLEEFSHSCFRARELYVLTALQAFKQLASEMEVPAQETYNRMIDAILRWKEPTL